MRPAKPRVLVVEDDPPLRDILARVLANGGFDVDGAGDGEEAARRLLETDYVAVVSDVTMPRMSGVELLRCVRVHDLEIPVILLTGALDLQMARDAIGHGVFQLLTKPVAPALLVSEVNRFQPRTLRPRGADIPASGRAKHG